MLQFFFAILNLLIPWLLWRVVNAKLMPLKDEESHPGCRAAVAEQDMQSDDATRSPADAEHSTATVPAASSTAGEEKAVLTHRATARSTSTPAEPQPGATSSKMQPDRKHTSQPLTSAKTQAGSRASRPKFSSDAAGRARLKFILGASEDNSSDDESPVVRPKPPSGLSDPMPPPQFVPPQKTAPPTPSPGMR